MSIVSLEDVLASLESGARPSGGVSADSGEIPSLGGEHLTGEGCFNFTNIKRIPRAFFETMRGGRIAERDILVVKDGATTGKTSFVGVGFPFPEAAVNEHVFCLRVDDSKASPEYVFHFLRSPIGQKEIYLDFRGATVGGISRAFAKKVRLPLPPLPEQRRIAEILDRADALRAKRRDALARLDTLAQSIFLEMFGDPATNPKGWPLDYLGRLAETTSGGTPRRGTDGYFGGDIPWVKSGELHEGVVTATNETLTERGLAESSAKLMPPGTVLVAMYGATVGAVAVLGIEAATNQAVCCIKPSESLRADYLVCLLRKMTPSLLAKRVGGAQPNLSQDLLRKLIVPVPPREIQDQFADRVAAVTASKHTAERSLQGSDALFASLQFHAFRGEL